MKTKKSASVHRNAAAPIRGDSAVGGERVWSTLTLDFVIGGKIVSP